jgi:hypothetical protein
MILQEAVKKRRPLGEFVEIVDGAVGPVEPVAPAKINAVNGDSTNLHFRCEQAKKRTWRTLQEEEGTRPGHRLAFVAQVANRARIRP